jgi:anti-sigma factor RsiW
VTDQHHVDIGANDMKQAMAWFSAHQGESNLNLPTDLNGNKDLMGCRVLDWHGQKVSMLCYALKGTMHVDVFVTEAGFFPDAPPQDQPQFANRDGLPTASWTHGGKAYLAVSHGNAAILENILSPEKFTLAKWRGDRGLRAD